MATSDMQKILGALLGGAQRGGIRPTRRRRSPAPLVDVRIGGSRSATAALATLAGAVLGSILGGGGAPPPAPARPGPAQGRASRSEPIDVAPASPRPPGSSEAPLPNPWSSRPAAQKPAAPPTPDTNAEDEEALLILRAMISCAKADGKLDAAERTAIAGQLDQAGLDQAARDLVLAEFASPASVAEIARAVRDPVLAAQVYAAAYLAAGEIEAAERGWLDGFAQAAGLDPRAAAAIEAKLSGG
jgi:tellurite resistance protein